LLFHGHTEHFYIADSKACASNHIKATECCVYMATLDDFILLTTTCRSEIIATKERKDIVAFAQQEWLGERASLLHYTYVAYIVPMIISIFLMHMPCRKIHRQSYTYNSMYVYSFFILCTERNISRMQTKFFLSFPHHIKG
jgi:hypothetical protein